MTRLMHAVALLMLMLGFAPPAVAAEKAIIILDGSGSMWAQIDGKARITIARETLATVLAELSDDLELGFMSYGHREKGNCDDIELLVPPATGTGQAITAAADAINPKGKTPISDAVRLAAQDLRFTEDKATVILITDGLETCDVDPCALASELEAKGVDFTTHVLGFGLSDEEGQQVRCLAENTGGRYLSAADGAGLVEALTTTVRTVTEQTSAPPPAPEPVVDTPAPPPPPFNLKPTVSLAEGSPDFADERYNIIWSWYRPASDGTAGEHVGTGYYSRFEDTLEPGDYILKVEIGNATAQTPITITADAVATPHLVLDAGILRLHPTATEGEEPDGDAVTAFSRNGESFATDYGDVDSVLPAGTWEAEIALGEGTVTRSYDLEAGEIIDEPVVLGLGTANVTSSYVADMPVKDDIYIEIFKAEEAIDGTRESVAYAYGDKSFQLPAGDYVVRYDLDGTEGEQPFAVAAGAQEDVALILDAGVLAVTTPEDDYVEILSATKDIAGNSTSFDYGYGPQWQTTLKAGDYIVHTEKGEVSSDTPITIVAGQRQELTVAPKPAKKK